MRTERSEKYEARCRWLAKAGVPDGQIDYGMDVTPEQLATCRARREHPQSIDVWEPLPTKSPGPNLTQPYCCYINTVIFYCKPYRVRQYGKPWRLSDRHELGWSKGGNCFEIWDELETLFRSNQVLHFDGMFWELFGGRVIWRHKRWWMRRSGYKNTRRAHELNGTSPTAPDAVSRRKADQRRYEQAIADDNTSGRI